MEFDLKNNQESLRQKGYRGKFMCDNCEQKTAELDRHASRIFKDENYPQGFIKQEKPLNTRFEKIYLWKGFDFKKVQNFIYSICLRQHFYNLSKGRKGVIIKEHLCPILNLYRSESIDDKSYPVSIIYFSRDSEFYKPPIISPHIDKMSGHHVIQFAACGFQFIVKVSSHARGFDKAVPRLESNGSAYVVQINAEDSKMMKRAIHKLRNFPEKS